MPGAGNAINETTTGICGFTGTAFTGTAVTNHNVILGGSTSSTLTNVAPSATSGVALISQGASADPTFGTVVVAGGGTGATTLTGLVTGNGTSAMTASAITQHDVLVGGASNAVTSVAPSATSGVPLISQGASSDPTFGTAVVAGGGTGQTTLTNHGVLVGAGTSAITQLATGSAGQVLQSGGASADPAYSTPTYPSASGSAGVILRSDGTNNVYTTATYPATTTSQQILYSTATNVIGQLTTANSKFPATNSSGTLAMRAFSVNQQIFTSGGTYTPTSGMLYCEIICLGAGGGGGGAATTTTTVQAHGGAGGAGEYAVGVFSAATIGASQSVTIGAAGTAGTAGANAGGNGGNTSVGALISANGGTGGGAGGVGNVNLAGSLGGTGGSGGSYRTPGAAGDPSFGVAASFTVQGNGANSQLGAGGIGLAGTSGAGSNALGFGAGGSGAVTVGSTQQAGGAGTAGIVIITEYVIA